MVVPAIPTEVKLGIAREVLAKRDILNLLICDSTFLYLCQPILYQHFKLWHGSRVCTERAIIWCNTIIANNRLALCVREIHVEDLYESPGLNNPPESPCYRLFSQVLQRLTNLRRLCFIMPRRYSSVLYAPEIHFPHLKSLFCLGVPELLPFIQSHPSITKLSFSNMPENDLCPEKAATGFLPNLECYDGPLDLIPKMSTTGLQRVMTKWPWEGVIKEVAPLLHNIGHTLRSLTLRVSQWEEGLFTQITVAVPNLERLQLRSLTRCNFDIDFSFGQPANLPQLRELELFGFKSPWRWDLNRQIVAISQLHRAFPSLRLARVATVALTRSDQKEMWRYNEVKHVWMPPISNHLWWKTYALILGLTRTDYEVIRPCEDGIHATFNGCHALQDPCQDDEQLL